MTNSNLETMPDLGPEWTRDTSLETPCFDARDATYWLWVEEDRISLDWTACGDFIIEAPDWPGLRAAAFEWIKANNVDQYHWVYTLHQIMVSTGGPAQRGGCYPFRGVGQGRGGQTQAVGGHVLCLEPIIPGHGACLR